MAKIASCIALVVPFWGVLLAAPALRAADESISPQDLEFFEARIRPALVKHCFECHSSEGEIKGGLRLDSAAGWKTGGDSGPAIIPGSPDDSLLLESLRYASYEMPPTGQLPENIIADFEEWVRRGAPDPRTTDPAPSSAPQQVDIQAGREFWAFRPLRLVDPPAVADNAWPRTDYDRFILSALEHTSLTPSPEASPEVLLRRIWYDLTGLPPPAAELQRFLREARSDLDAALARVVDELLQSPDFGDHWGRHWLDVARYADSNGSDFNATFHEAWRYRDYVVASVNSDKPFDRFLREQIAGDLLPWDSDAQRTEQLIATGFLMLGPKMLSERDKAKLEMDVVDEQIDSLGRAFLGMTLGCARCHDHKFDPIPTTDYYALAGIFRSTRTLDGEIQKYVSNWTRQPLPIAPEHAQALEQHAAQMQQVRQELKAAQQELKQQEAAASSNRTLGIIVDDSQATLVGDWKPSTYVDRFIGKGYIHDEKERKGEKSVTWTPHIPAAGEYEVRISFAGGGGRDSRVPVVVRHAKGETRISVDQSKAPPIDDLLLPLGRFHFNEGTSGSVTLSTEGTTQFVLADAAQFIPVDELENRKLDPNLLAAINRIKDRISELEATEKSLKENAPPPAPRALAPREAETVGDCPVCIRGEHNHHGPIVPRGVLQVASPEGFALNIPEGQSGRLQLADWIANPENPLTARVFVNRVWCHLVGEGIVRTVDNFGTLGDRPSHPELLDRLAADFIADGWSLKSLVRQIVLSRFYRQSSVHREDAFLIDPDNRLLWRAHRKRLSAESIRDSLLAISGTLDDTRGESPVSNLGTLVNNNSASDKAFEQKQSGRKSLYLPVIRNELPSLFVAFDFADPDFVTGRRAETNVPAQALVLLNSPLVLQSADAAARRMLSEASADPYARVEWCYHTILTRSPTSAEADRALAFVDSLTADDELRPWSRLIHVLVASTQFRMLD